MEKLTLSWLENLGMDGDTAGEGCSPRHGEVKPGRSGWEVHPLKTLAFRRRKAWLIFPLILLLLAGCGSPTPAAGTSETAKGDAPKAGQPKATDSKTTEAEAAKGQQKPQALGQTFADAEGHVALKVPYGWEAFGYEGALVALVSPQNGEEDFFRENLLVTMDAKFEILTFPRYLKAMDAEVRKRYPDTQTLEHGEIEVGGETAHWIIDSFTSPKGPAKVYRVVLLRDTVAYVLHGTAPAQTFDRYRPTFEAIAKSITFPDAKP